MFTDLPIAELSLTVPIVNTLAFLFTVVGDWWVDGKVISRSKQMTYPNAIVVQAQVEADQGSSDTMIGMFLSLTGIALCVHSKNT